MSYEQRNDSGILFKNDRKANEKQPDYNGSCKIDGKLYNMAAWLKEGKKGKFMTFAFSPKVNAPSEDVDADVPF